MTPTIQRQARLVGAIAPLLVGALFRAVVAMYAEPAPSTRAFWWQLTLASMVPYAALALLLFWRPQCSIGLFCLTALALGELYSLSTAIWWPTDAQAALVFLVLPFWNLLVALPTALLLAIAWRRFRDAAKRRID
jgi:hypothetical protein